MQKAGEHIILSATDLANHLACRHLTELNRKLAHGELKKPYRDDPILETIVERGNEHEAAYVEHLREDRGTLVEFEQWDEQAAQKTLTAMRTGADVIVQGALGNDRWIGRPDLLLKKEKSGKLGDWSYEVADTKLTRNTQAGTILQLCLYSDLLAELQGVQPEHMSVIKPGEPFDVETYRVDDYAAYYRFAKLQLESTIDSGSDNSTYPDPVSHCDICRWWSVCDQQRRDDDHLSYVAGIQKSHIVELNRQRIDSLTVFAESDKPLTESPKRGSIEAYEKAHKQAQIQLRGKRSGQPEYEFLDVEEQRGFLRLPEPNAGDIFFDIEGDPHVAGGGLEYLLGYVIAVDSGEQDYRCEWALDRDSEKHAFESFIDFVMDNWSRHPGMHIYHYAPYEPSAMKRLASRHGTREDQLDQLLRGERFVDLYAIVRQGLRASVESYSIKRLEAFYGYKRLEELADARHSLHRLERALELGTNIGISDEDRHVVQVYNQDDCLSTVELRNWLEERRTELAERGVALTRPDIKHGDATEKQDNTAAEVAEVFGRLTAGIEQERNTADEEARWLLAHLLEYFRREDKCNWWEYFRMHSLEHEELVRERTAIAGLQFEREMPLVGRQSNPTHRYCFEPQDVTMEIDDELVQVMGERVGYVADIDFDECTLDIKKRGDSVDIHPDAVFCFSWVNPEPMPKSLLNFAKQVVAAHNQGKELLSARYDLLCKRSPRLKTLSLPAANDQKEAAIELAFDLDNSVLPFQGPPGAGKTFIGSHMIAALARGGKRVGVTAVSHKVILNMLTSVYEESKADGVVAVAHQTTDRDGVPDFVGRLKNKDESLAALDEGVVVGGTAWLWSNQAMEQSLDYLFIDEAGQMSLAMAVAAGRAAKNIVLLGDPQQLEQPQQGIHPEGADVAALTHVLDGAETMPDDKGMFLRNTWRLHPKICEFTSEQYYRRRLHSEPGLELQEVFGDSSFVGSGLRIITVEHAGNQNRSDEEVSAIVGIVEKLTNGNHQWSNKSGKLEAITLNDILTVAPYNAQVGALQRALPAGARVGTVDKFQGQEAPIVIYSMTSSSAADAPRGMGFLFSRNRMNVATSRARCLAILAGAPALFEPSCSTPDQIRLANGFCRYLEVGERLPPADL